MIFDNAIKFLAKTLSRKEIKWPILKNHFKS